MCDSVHSGAVGFFVAIADTMAMSPISERSPSSHEKHLAVRRNMRGFHGVRDYWVPPESRRGRKCTFVKNADFF